MIRNVAAFGKVFRQADGPISAEKPPNATHCLEDFASEVEKRALRAVEKHGSYRAAAAKLGLHQASVHRACQRVKRRAASQGFAPEAGWTNRVPDPHFAKGVSTLYGKDGNVKLQWVKSQQDSDERAALLWREWREEFAEPCKGVGRLPKLIVTPSDRLCNEFVIGDPHLGMHAWAEETLGDDYDTAIAERIHIDVMKLLVSSAPPADTANIVCLGDLTHADNFQATTRASGNRLDVDSRYPKVVRTALRTVRSLIHLAAQNHKKVRLVLVPGNHDEHTSVALAEAFAMHFEGDSRIEVDNSGSPDKFFVWGKTLSMYTHGHRMRGRMQAKLSKHPAWSSTTEHHVKHGHIHHNHKQEIGNCYLETFEVLPPADAWHAGEGYAAGRSMTRITYDLEHGEVGRGRVPVSMVKQAA